MKNTLVNNVKKLQVSFYKEINILIESNPFYAVILLYEYNRQLYPTDPYLSFNDKDHLKRIFNSQKNILEIIKNLKNFDGYDFDFKDKSVDKVYEVKKKTGEVYGKLWGGFSKTDNLHAKKMLVDRFKGFDSFHNLFFKNKTVIDFGCGGGRYTNAIRMLGAKNVVGIDFGIEGINIAKKNYKYKNINFLQKNVLNTKINSNVYDIVFSNGVLHHTTDYKKGIKECIRICKPEGYVYLYLYGAEGIFWDARKRNRIIRKIPQLYATSILKLYGVPGSRFVFLDNWYVPIEEHIKRKDLETYLTKLGIRDFEYSIGIKDDINYASKKLPHGKDIWGEGEIRILFKKP